MTATRAKRGDLVALERVSTYASATGPSRSATSVDVHIVTSITRDGVVKATRPLHGSDLGREERYPPERPQPIERMYGLKARYVIPAGSIRYASAIAAVLAHHYEGHPGQLKPYDSIEACCEALRPFVIRPRLVASA